MYPHPRDGGGGLRARGSAEASRGARRPGRRKRRRGRTLSSPAFGPGLVLPPAPQPRTFPAPACVRAPTWAARPPPRDEPIWAAQYFPAPPCACSWRGGMRGEGPELLRTLRDSGSASGRGGATPVPCPAGPPSPARPGGHRVRHQVEDWEG